MNNNAEELLALALAAGQSTADAAKSVGVSERTVRRRLAEREFREQVQRFRSELIDRASGELADTMLEAVRTLRELLTEPDPRIRLHASKAILEAGSKLQPVLPEANSDMVPPVKLVAGVDPMELVEARKEKWPVVDLCTSVYVVN